MPLLLYTCLFYAISPLLVLRLLQRSLRAPEYRRRIGERFSFFAAPSLQNSIWVHAVSVGEVIAALPMIRELQRQYPARPIVVTTMTPTGSARVRDSLGDSVFHVYAPYDLPLALRRFMKKVDPSLLIIMETEIWPNMVCCARAADVEVVLANARLSEKSARGYARLESLTRTVFSRFSTVVAQAEADAERFRTLGVADARLRVSGSIKFDIEVSPSLREKARQERSKMQAAERPVWICASTHDGEESIILDAFRQLQSRVPDLLLLIAPRHPERFGVVAQLLAARGFAFNRRSAMRREGRADVELLDTMGELMCLLGCADVATVGGSLIERGGHNSLEPAAWGLPLVNGPSDYNFPVVSGLLQQAGALTFAATAQELAAQIEALLQDPALRHERGTAAKAVVDKNRGALQRLLGEIDALLR